jgi:hypothetical protein
MFIKGLSETRASRLIFSVFSVIQTSDLEKRLVTKAIAVHLVEDQIKAVSLCGQPIEVQLYISFSGTHEQRNVMSIVYRKMVLI